MGLCQNCVVKFFTVKRTKAGIALVNLGHLAKNVRINNVVQSTVSKQGYERDDRETQSWSDFATNDLSLMSFSACTTFCTVTSVDVFAIRRFQGVDGLEQLL